MSDKFFLELGINSQFGSDKENKQWIIEFFKKTFIFFSTRGKFEDPCFYIRKGHYVLKSNSSMANTKVLLVEGLTDCYFITAFNIILSTLNRETLNREIKIVPLRGITKLPKIGNILLNNGIDVVCLIDGDPGGKLVFSMLPQRSSLKQKCFFYETFLFQKNAELEDWLPESIYLSAIKETYQIRKLKIAKETRQVTEMAKKIKMILQENGISVTEKWKIDWFVSRGLIEQQYQLPETTIKLLENMFTILNKSFDDPSPRNNKFSRFTKDENFGQISR